MSKNANMTKYLWEMWDIAHANKMDLGVGRDMFWANLNNHGVEGAPHYVGANQLDYAVPAAVWKTLSGEERGEQKILCSWICRKYVNALADARKQGDRAKWERIVAQAVTDFYTAQEEIENREYR